ncbi:hypothetical protein F1188_19960 [Roseospira marina]|uniref:Uncharacterized protein n=1 Tax=Roseospira marina TaxID=140057 RepID=A0A5M6I4Z3_9PROT|nr:hypothetical protein [Roseospira marina]KAA5603223.1 hypothetical protein F1188_19960 [Roseospira marina]MBB4316203.1 hypothetical protein [Roseospira marina]MBB5089401.1 hypothetical protein [Roseospira marina]
MAEELDRRLRRIDSMDVAIAEKMPRIRRYLKEFETRNIALTQDDLIELTLRFASARDEKFYAYMKENLGEVVERPTIPALPYVPPSAAVVSTEKAEAAIAAVLGIGIGWVWAWLAVSPWSADKTGAPVATS